MFSQLCSAANLAVYRLSLFHPGVHLRHLEGRKYQNKDEELWDTHMVESHHRNTYAAYRAMQTHGSISPSTKIQCRLSPCSCAVSLQAASLRPSRPWCHLVCARGVVVRFPFGVCPGPAADS